MLPFIIAGLTTGSVYGLAGVGLVLTYKTSGIFNFAYGALATISAYLFYTLHVRHHMAWPLAGFLCVFVLGPLLGVAFERLGRVLTGTSLATRVAATVGILLIVQAGAVIIYGTDVIRSVPAFLGSHEYHIGSTAVEADQIVVFAVGMLATVGLYIYFRIARLGVAMRAVVDDPGLLDLSGTSPIVVRRWAWIIGVTFASASGLLIVPFITLDATTLTFLVVAAFGAAAIGGFSNIPGTYLGGLTIGILASLATKYFTSGLLSGVSPTLPFIVLFIVLLVAPRRRLAERAPMVPRGQSAWTTPWQIQVGLGTILLVFLCFVPSFANIHLADFSRALAITVVFLSLGLLIRTSGQVSLCQVSFMAIGVVAFSHLSVGHGLPWILALLAAGIIAVPIGALLSIPAIRLSGLYLALATFGFGILLQYMFYTESYMFGDLGLGVTIPKPVMRSIGLTGSDKSYYYFVLVIAMVCTAFVVAINKSRLGRLLRALADSPRGLATSGTSINVTRVLVFCISAFFAAIGGVLDAGAIGQVSGDGYQPILSLTFFTLIVISVGGAPWYAVISGFAYMLIPSYVTNPNTAYWLQLLFGVFAILYAITPSSMQGAPLAVQKALDRLVRRKRVRHDPVPVSPTTATVPSLEHVSPGKLEIADLRVAFGGLVAVDGVSIETSTGQITGLIGPNGAGKTTTFNACSGLNRPSRGRVVLDGRDISRYGPASRARGGIGRTFQQTELFDSLTVWENVALGLEAGQAGPNALRHIASTPGLKRRVEQAAQDALRQCDLESLANTVVGSLSTGQRRLVELARCLAGPFQILLLDEPSSGLDRVETSRFGEILQRAVCERGVGILLVEHDMALVTEICDYVYVLDFGKPIFQGTAAEMISSPIVQSAYLGDAAVEAAVEENAVDPDPRITL